MNGNRPTIDLASLCPELEPDTVRAIWNALYDPEWETVDPTQSVILYVRDGETLYEVTGNLIGEAVTIACFLARLSELAHPIAISVLLDAIIPIFRSIQEADDERRAAKYEAEAAK